MYLIKGWAPGGGVSETVLETWEDILILFSWLEEDMYSNLLVTNVLTGKDVAGF